jgi:hypothetical protein
MANFAQIDSDNIVTTVIVVADSDATNEAVGIAFCQDLLGADTNWVQTKEDGSIRFRWANIGDEYDSTNDVFRSQQPFPSWTLNTTTWMWDCPVDKPTDEGLDTLKTYETDAGDPGNSEIVTYEWDEDSISWTRTVRTILLGYEGIDDPDF